MSIENSAPPVGDKSQFKEVWNRIQAQYGAKPEQARQIKKSLDKDDFLKIMITQMQHQDPTKPFDADKLATEIAQITSIEQLRNVNNALNKLSDQNRPLERLTMTNLIGKEVTVDRSRFTHKKGETSTVAFDLPANSKETKVTLVSETGEKILEKDLGDQKMGRVSFNWDGKKENTTDADTGGYYVRVEAKDVSGTAIPINTSLRSRIVGVNFQGDEPFFLVGDPTHQDKIKMSAIVQVDDPVGLPPQIAQNQVNPAGPQISAAQPKSPQAFKLPAGIAEKVAKDQQEMNESGEMDLQEQMKSLVNQIPAANVQQPIQHDDSRGFPNGLNMSDEPNQIEEKNEQR